MKPKKDEYWIEEAGSQIFWWEIWRLERNVPHRVAHSDSDSKIGRDRDMLAFSEAFGLKVRNQNEKPMAH